MLSRLGITSLFLFAGLEVDVDELKKDRKALSFHLMISFALQIGLAILLSYIFDIGVRVSILLSLGLMTPSTGFILSSLKNYDLDNTQKKWIKAKAISSELMALVIMYMVMQSYSFSAFFWSTAVLVSMILILPVLFRFFLAKIVPYAPDSEVVFLLLIALLCGVITKKIGIYYLVGAFLVGMTAGRFSHFMESKNSDKFLYSVSLFFSFFIPFYFYRAGLTFDLTYMNLKGGFYGLCFLVFLLPIRYFGSLFSIKFFINESFSKNRSVAMPLIPNLIFGLVIASIITNTYANEISGEIVSGLIFYTIVVSILPWVFLNKTPIDEYELLYNKAS
jgi:Kef-type K+ transport system membrane component KefB